MEDSKEVVKMRILVQVKIGVTGKRICGVMNVRDMYIFNQIVFLAQRINGNSAQI